MSKRTTLFTPDLLKGITPAPPPPPKVFSSPNVDLGKTIFTKPSGFELTTKAFGRKRKKEQVTQIYLHHTAGHQRTDKGEKTVRTFNNRALANNYGSTHAVIDANGHLEELIPWDYIAYGQGIKGSKIHYNTVGMSIEIMALGYFKTLSKDKKTWYRDSTSCPADQCAPGVDYNLKDIKYKGYQVYQKYTNAQIQGTIKWVKQWMAFFNISFKFDQDAYDNMFPSKGNLSPKATSGKPGVYSHNSVHLTKSDIYPDKELVKAFKAAFK
jgi:hypothetical protein